MFKRDRAIPAVAALACFLCGLPSARAACDVTPDLAPTEGFAVGATRTCESEGAEVIREGAGGAYGDVRVKCPRCGKAGDVKAAECERCGFDYPLASAYAETVFVSGKSYCWEGALRGPPENRPVGFPEGRVWFNPGPLATTGAVLVFVGAGAVIVGIGMLMYDLCRLLSDKDYDSYDSFIVASAGLAVMTVGVVLVVMDFTFDAEHDCGFAPRAPEVGGGYGRRPGGLTLEFGLSFSPM